MMGFYGFILEHDGHIYPCVNCESYSFGNVVEQAFDAVWFGAQAAEARKNLRETCCPTCPSMCYTPPAGPLELAQVVGCRVFSKMGNRRRRVSTLFDRAASP